MFFQPLFPWVGIFGVGLLSAQVSVQASRQVPKPDHVVIAILENHAYTQIIGSASAPYLNQLARDTHTAVFTQSFALTHPSQPNYLMLFSGSAQHVTDDAVPGGLPFTTPNLAAELSAQGLSYAAYSEDLPSVGFAGKAFSKYVRKHAPWVNWQGSGPNGISPSTHLPFDSFPSDFDRLPTVAFVVPNLINDIHDGTVSQGDTWIHDKLDGYIQWAKTHHSLFILTFDEDDQEDDLNRITTLFSGAHVKGGKYSERITHYTVLRTLEDMFSLQHAGAAATASPILGVWKPGAR